MSDKNTLSGSPGSGTENNASGDDKNPDTETPKETKNSDTTPVAESSPSSETTSPRGGGDGAPVGVELPPLGDDVDAEEVSGQYRVSDAFKTALIGNLRNVLLSVDAIGNLHKNQQISQGMRNHLEKEALRYTAGQICDMVEREVSNNN